MVLAVDSPPTLHAWAQAMGTILLIELIVVLVIIAALITVLAVGARWLQMHVVPVLNTTVPRAHQALAAANQGSDRVVRGVAEVYGIRKAIETGVRTLLFGRDGAFPIVNLPRDAREPVTTAEPAATPTPLRPPAASAQQRPAAPAERQPTDRDLNNMTAHAG